MRIVVDSHIPHIQGLIEPFANVEYLEPVDITTSAVREADALIVRTRTRCNAALLDGSRVKFIGSATIGTDHIDLDYCSSHGITVRNAPGCNAPAVAQWVFCAIAAWMRHHNIATPDGLTLGIVGVGHIGSIVARWGRQLGFNVLLNDPPREMAEKTEKWRRKRMALVKIGTGLLMTFSLPLTSCSASATSSRSTRRSPATASGPHGICATSISLKA